MAQFYQVTDVKYWTTMDPETGEEIQIKDTFGNYKLSVTFEGQGEPVDMTAKNPPKINEQEYGHIEPYTTKAGKIRHKFKRDLRDDSGTGEPGVVKTPASPPVSTQEPAFKAPKTQAAAETKYLKDISDLPDRWMGRLLPFYDVQRLVVNGKPTAQYTNLVETARIFAEESLLMIDNIRKGEGLYRRDKEPELSPEEANDLLAEMDE